MPVGLKERVLNLLNEICLRENARIYEVLGLLLHVSALLIEEHLNGEQNRRLLIWSLLNFEYWMEQTFD
jgi:asparagine synthase (glutamine-hydrolysing)